MARLELEARTRTRTSSPRATSWRATWLPRKPEAPVTRVVMRSLKTAAQAEFAGLEGERGVLLRFLRLVAEACQRIERKRIPIQVIFQVEDAGKSCAGKFVLTPRAIGVLLLDEIGGGLVDCRIGSVCAGQ